MKKKIGIFFMALAFITLIPLVIGLFQTDIDKENIMGNLIAFFMFLTIGVILFLAVLSDKKYDVKMQKKYELERKRKSEEERNIKISQEKAEKERFVELTNKVSETLNSYAKKEGDEILLNDFKDFDILLKKNQDVIIEIKREYIQDFIKISNYLKAKKDNIKLVFNSINNSKSIQEVIELDRLLKNKIYTYNIVLFHSINMITSLVKNDMIIFYEIYEKFDGLDIFNSNWEKNISEKLDLIGDKLDDISNEIGDLNYMSENLLESLGKEVTAQLESIDSSIKFNNLLTGIQAYKLNNNTKKLIR
ncbi:MAG: hypothetical protein H2058_11910 [Muricauda sp.]|nr:hypothetical protein [Allomuricauda sp.]MBA4745951.1 hypothetical protein [Allomuricauda sp.]